MTIRLIDANKLKEALKQNLPQYMHREMLVTVNIQPTIDAVVVTRCKNCRYAEYNSDFDEYRCGLSRFSHDGDYYCADAELKDEPFDKDINVRSKGESQLKGSKRLLKGKGEPQTEYERASEQREHDILYEPTYNKDDGSV